MFKNKRLFRIINLILCFSIFFSFGNVVHAAPITDFIVETMNKIIGFFTELLISLGDGLVHLVTSSVGEPVTIDKLVFGDVKKVNIDYWNDTGIEGTNATQKSVKAFMAPVVNRWYGVFFEVALIVYMIVLVFIGVSILFTSTAEKKANYKDRLVTWVMGITILFMFPYVMKYIILINNACVKTLQAKSVELGYGEAEKALNELAEKSFYEVAEYYGDDEFINLMKGVPVDSEVTEDNIGDTMLITRYAALKDKEQGESNMTLAIVYLILIGQMIAVLIMYYKRAFMVAFLITIFPLVAMTYVLDKLGDGKNQSFGIWFKEFIVNVIVQMFHAVVYTLIVGAGIKSYIEGNGSNVLFMMLCVLFLFEGEKILRSIFNIKSQANTMGDIAASGAIVAGMAGKMGGVFKRNNPSASPEDKKEVDDAKKRNQNRSNKSRDDTKAAIAKMDSNVENGEGDASYGEYQGPDKEPAGVKEDHYDGQAARDTALTSAMKRKLAVGFSTKAVNFAAGAVGATLATTKDLSDGKSSPANVIGDIAVGRAAGQAVAAPITAATNKLEQMHYGNKMARQIRKGEMDKELGLDKMVPPPTAGTPGDDLGPINPGDYEDKFDDRQKIYREALAKYAKAAAKGGNAKGEIAYYNYLEKNLNKDK